MSTAAKVAICSYCSTRVVIPLSGDVRHELICTSCGAPLKNTRLIHQPPPVTATAQSLFETRDIQPPQKDPADKKLPDKKKRDRKRQDSEDYIKSKKYKSDDSDSLNWSDELEDLSKKYKKYIKRKRKKSSKKRRGLFYWIREAADEIDDLFD